MSEEKDRLARELLERWTQGHDGDRELVPAPKRR
jgi:hypothetical protein